MQLQDPIAAACSRRHLSVHARVLNLQSGRLNSHSSVLRAAVISALENTMIWAMYSKPEVSANLMKAAQAKMEAAGALGDAPAGAKAV